MCRNRSFLILFLAAWPEALMAEPTRLVFEAEEFASKENQPQTDGDVCFLRLGKDEKLSISLRETLDPGEFQFLLRVRFPWDVALRGPGTSIRFKFGDEEKEFKVQTAGDWRWVRLGRFGVKEFESRPAVVTAGNVPVELDQLVLWSGDDPGGETWYRRAISPLWIAEGPAVAVFENPGGEHFLEAESALTLRGEKTPIDPAGMAVAMSQERSELSFLIDAKRPANAQILLKMRSAADSGIKAEGPLFVLVDGDLAGSSWGGPAEWTWQRAGHAALSPGRHVLTLLCGRAPLVVDQLVLFGGDPHQIVMKEWYRSLRSPLYRQEVKPGRTLKAGQKELLLEAEDLDDVRAAVMRDAASGTRTIVFREWGSCAHGLIQVEETTKLRLFVRTYFDLENQIAGDANSLFAGFDDEGLHQLASGVYNRYHWLATPPVDVLPGKHLVSLRCRELPVRTDRLILYAGDDAEHEPWFAETYPEPMPLGLPNTLRADEAQQIQNWRVFGELAGSTRVRLTHDVRRNQYYSVEMQFPEGRRGQSLILSRRGHAVLRTSPASTRRNRDQQADMWVWADGAGCSIQAAILDAEGKEWAAPFTEKADWTGWQQASLDLGAPLAANPLLAEIPFPVTLKYLVVRKNSDRPAVLRIEEPEFTRPLRTTAAYTDGRMIFDVSNASPVPRTVVVSAAFGPLADWVSGHFRPTCWSHAQVTVPASGKAQTAVAMSRADKAGGGAAPEPLPALPEGAWAVLCRLGAETPSPRFVTVEDKGQKELAEWMTKAEREHGGFRLPSALRKPSGQPIRREDVASLYGRPDGFRILVDGQDACSRDYATKAGHERLRAEGRDLSDANGWPLIHVPPGVLAIDPESGRCRFAEGDADPPQLAGRLNTGFGVPGSGPIAVRGDFAFVPAGEGDMTIVDCSDKQKPRVATILPSYHFTHSVVFHGDRAYIDSRDGGECLVDDLADPEHPGPIRQIGWAWGRGIHAIHSEANLAYRIAGNEVTLIDISSPDSPREAGVVRLPRKISGMAMTPDRKFAYGLLEGGESIGVISLANPRSPELVGAVPNTKLSDLKPKKVTTEEDEMTEPDGEDAPKPGKPDSVGVDLSDEVKSLDKQFGGETAAHIASVDDGGMVVRLGTTYVFYDLADRAKPRRCGHYTFQDQGLFLRDARLRGRFLYVLDGRQSPSQHGLSHTSPHSRFFVVSFSDPAAPKLAALYEDPDVTEYSNLTLQGNHAYVNDYDYGLWIFDISNPAKPVKLGGTPTAGEGHWGLAHGNLAFIAQTFGGSIIVVDVSDPTRPKRRGTYWDGDWMNYNARMAASGTCLYVPKDSRLIIVDSSDPDRPKRAGEFLDEKQRSLVNAKILVEDDLAYVVCQKDGKAFLHTYDLSRAHEPRLLHAAKLDDRPIPFRLAKEGPRLYAAGDNGTHLLTIDVRDAAAPRVVSRYASEKIRYGDKDVPFSKEGGWNGGVSACRGYLYVTIGASPPGEPVVHIFDARQPERLLPITPIHVNRGGWQFFYVDVLALGTYLYGGDYGVIDVFDVADPARPKLVGGSGRDYQWTLGNILGDYLYVGKLPGLDIADVPRSSQIPTGEVTIERLR